MLNKAFTLVEMLVALAVGAIVIMATYASYEMVDTQYKKNIDVANMHTSGRSIMQIIERDVRMAGFEYRHTSGANKGKKAFSSSIATPLDITDSGNKCCDEVTVIYDYFDEASRKAERIRIRYWTEPHTSNKGSRHRLYKQKDILGRNGNVLTNPALGRKEVMADYIEDFQIVNVVNSAKLYSGSRNNENIEIIDIETLGRVQPESEGWIVGTAKNSSMTFGSNGLLYTGSAEKSGITIYDPKNNKKGRYAYIDTWSSVIDSIAVDKNGLIYVGKKGISIWDTSTKKNMGSISKSTNSESALALDSDGFLYTGSSYNLRVYNTHTKILHKNRRTWTPTVDVTSVAISGDVLWAGTKNGGGVRSYSKGNLKQNLGLGRPIPSIGRGIKTGNRSVSTIAIGRDGNIYVGIQGQRGIGVFNMQTRQHEATISTKYIVSALAFGKESSGQESLVTINLTLRTKNQYGKDRQFKKQDYHGGNFKIDKTDKYKRDTFSTTVLVRNLAL